MAKHALRLFIKIVLFAVVMLTVAKIIPYNGMVNSITNLFNSQSADSFTRFILGEPDLEMRESLHVYFSVMINILISVPVMSAMTTIFHGVIHKINPVCLSKEWTFSTLQLFVKIFLFTLLFWILFRFLPYQSVFPMGTTYSFFTIVAVVFCNLLLTTACYWLIMKKTIIKRIL